MASSLAFDVLALDKASKTFERVGDKVERLTERLERLDRKDVDVDVDVDKGLRNVNNFADTSVSVMAGAFRIVSANAIVMGAAVAAALAALPAVAALAATGIVLGFGGALAGIGIIAAAQSKRVQSAFSDLADHVGDTLRDITKPFRPVLVEIANQARGLFDAFVPVLRKSFELLAPVVERFAFMVRAMLQQFVIVVGPFSRAFKALLQALGPVLLSVADETSHALVGLAQVVRRNATQFAAFIGLLLRSIPLAITAVAELAGLFGTVGDKIRASARDSSSVLGQLLQTIREFTTLIRLVWAKWGNEIQAVVRAAWSFVQRYLGSVLQQIRGLIKIATGIIRGDWSQVWQGVRMIFQNAWNQIRAILSGALAAIKAVFSSAWNGIREGAARLWNGVRSAFRTGVNAVKAVFTAAFRSMLNFFLDIAEGVLAAADKMFGWVPGVGDKLGDALAAFRTWRAGIDSEMNKAAGIAASGARGIASNIIGAFRGIAGSAAGIGNSIGSSLGAGIQAGISSMVGGIMAVAAAAVNAAESAARSAADSHSPSRLFMRLGKDLARGLNEGILDRTERQRLLNNVGSMVRAARDKLQTEMGKLQSALQARGSIVSSFASGFASSIFGATTAEGDPIASLGGIMKFAEAERRQARHVSAATRKLIDKGLSKSLIRQLRDQGEAGQAQLFTLAQDASRKELLRLNRMNAQRQKALRRAGLAVGNELVGARIDRSRDQVQRARDRERDAEVFMRKLKKLLDDGIRMKVGPRGNAWLKSRGG